MAALTHCPYCALNCGLGLRHEGGVVVGFERWKRSPLTGGALCAKGVTAWEQMPHPERITEPLIRRGGNLVPTDWQTALNGAADGLAWVANPALRRDTVFLPYHWPVANQLTAADQLDPTSRIPNFKVTPVRVGPASAPAEPDGSPEPGAAAAPR